MVIIIKKTKITNLSIFYKNCVIKLHSWSRFLWIRILGGSILGWAFTLATGLTLTIGISVRATTTSRSASTTSTGNALAKVTARKAAFTQRSPKTGLLWSLLWFFLCYKLFLIIRNDWRGLVYILA